MPWKHLLCLPYLCLHIPPRNNVSRSKEKSLTSKVSSNLRNMLESLDRDDCHWSRCMPFKSPRKPRSPKDPKSFLADKISEKISEGNIKGAFGLHHQIALSFFLMQKRHPSCVRNIPRKPDHPTLLIHYLRPHRSIILVNLKCSK